MSSDHRAREHLSNLVNVLSAIGQSDLAQTVNSALSKGDDELDHFLISNELWGGSGSIADQAGITRDGRIGNRRRVEEVLCQLGEEQIRLEKTNERTAMWVTAFKKWAEDDI